jgi:hypothetical protein
MKLSMAFPFQLSLFLIHITSLTIAKKMGHLTLKTLNKYPQYNNEFRSSTHKFIS